MRQLLVLFTLLYMMAARVLGQQYGVPMDPELKDYESKLQENNYFISRNHWYHFYSLLKRKSNVHRKIFRHYSTGMCHF
jgi:hypothetical protein